MYVNLISKGLLLLQTRGLTDVIPVFLKTMPYGVDRHSMAQSMIAGVNWNDATTRPFQQLFGDVCSAANTFTFENISCKRHIFSSVSRPKLFCGLIILQTFKLKVEPHINTISDYVISL